MGYNKIVDELSLDELKEIARDVISWNGQLDYLDYYENDEYFFNDFFQGKVDEAVRAVCYGNYNYMDDYVKFNAYGNLDSCSQFEYDREIEDNAEEIVEAYIDNIDDMYDDDLKKKIKDLLEESEEEDETFNN